MVDLLHLVKSMARACRSGARTLYMGDLAVDMASMFRHGLPPRSAQGRDCHSDRQAFEVLLFVQHGQVGETVWSHYGMKIFSCITLCIAVAWQSQELSLQCRQLLCHFANYYLRMAKAWTVSRGAALKLGKKAAEKLLLPAGVFQMALRSAGQLSNRCLCHVTPGDGDSHLPPRGPPSTTL